MKKFIQMLPLIILSSCFPDFKNTPKDRLYLKKIISPIIELECYTYSAAYANSPTFVTAEIDNKLDTLCIADNILDINVLKNNITIYSIGPVSLYTKNVKVKNLRNFKIELDSSAPISTPRVLKYFKQ